MRWAGRWLQMIDIFDVKSELEGVLMADPVSVASLRARGEALTPQPLTRHPPARPPTCSTLFGHSSAGAAYGGGKSVTAIIL